MPRVSIHIVTWNSRHFLDAALESLAAQTFKNFSIIAVDNGSVDGTIDFIREKYPQVITLRNFNNLGFARAHNQAIELARSRYARLGGPSPDTFILVMNPDVVLAPDYLEKLLLAADFEYKVASLVGSVYRLRESRDGELLDYVQTNTFDTTGLCVSASGRATDRGAGEEDRGQFERAGEIFGVSGALACYRLSALEDIYSVSGEYFDERFFAYKEDIDLAWRLRRLGWRAWHVPEARAYHLRAAYGSEKRGLKIAWRERRIKSDLVNRLSYRNHFWLLAKNLDWLVFLRYSPLIIAREVFKLFYLAFVEPRTLAVLPETFASLPMMFRKRRAIFESRKIPVR
ncbi:glycosyltransferase family 2 protein [Patescibacteria group bacterium]|nr:MAG: glycosyltransferase family 2 protein [Patescibacteria group bacterium]